MRQEKSYVRMFLHRGEEIVRVHPMITLPDPLPNFTLHTCPMPTPDVATKAFAKAEATQKQAATPPQSHTSHLMLPRRLKRPRSRRQSPPARCWC